MSIDPRFDGSKGRYGFKTGRVNSLEVGTGSSTGSRLPRDSPPLVLLVELSFPRYWKGGGEVTLIHRLKKKSQRRHIPVWLGFW